MKVLLANLPWKRSGQWGVRAGSRWPHIKTVQEKGYLPYPFFLAYAGALLKKEGFEVKLIDSLAQEISVRDFLKIVSRETPDLLVAETSTPSLWNDLGILKKISEKFPVALCGPEANIRDPGFLSRHNFIHYVFIGEYEFTLLELVQRLESKKDLSGLRGLIYRENGDFKVNSVRPLLEDLDKLPWPLRSELSMEKYSDTPGGIPSPSAQMWSSRGCPYQCLFCVWPQLMYQSNRYRVRNVVKVVDEMEYLVKEMGFKSIYFDDDTTNISTLRMKELAGEIINRNLKIPWAMMARADLMEEDVLEKLRSAGLFAVKYGVESSSQDLLDGICKNMDLRKTERMIRYTQSLGIKTHLTFSFGLPGETLETIQKTIDFAKALNPGSVQFSIATAFPGTSYFRELDRKGHIISCDYSEYDGNFKSMLRTENLGPQDLQKAKRRADRVWQAYVWKTRCGHYRFIDYFKKFISYIRSYGFFFAFSRAFSFLRNNITFEEIHFKKILGDFSFRKWRSWKDFDGAVKKTVKKIKKRYLNILGTFDGTRAFKGPDSVQIDLTSNCNNNCVSCWCNSPLLGNKAYRGSKKYKTLPAPLVERAIDELADMGTSELFFSGGGEPFMHPDILSIIKYAKGRGLHCSINTNFTKVDGLTAKKLADLSVDALTVSVWAATPKTYALTHPNKDEATFHRIKSTLRLLNHIKNASGKPYVKVYNVISNLNYRELEAMVEFAEETGCHCVEFTVVDTIPGATEQLLLSKEERREVLQQCQKIKARKNKIEISNLDHFIRRLSDQSADSAQYDSGLVGRSPCYVGWVFSRIMSNGDVNFCLKAHRIPVGNLYKNSFYEIWHSEEQGRCRNKALQKDLSDPFFKGIGNDENCSMGCYKSCDNLGHNALISASIEAMQPFEKKFFRILMGAAEWGRKLKRRHVQRK
jgi:anaerobic magnesium-protoporphyrin IX monomethyl ester cyclase